MRSHKGNLPGREKQMVARQLWEKERQRAARWGLLQSLRSFFTADSFMYGPLLSTPNNLQPTTAPVSPEGRGLNVVESGAERERNEGEQEGEKEENGGAGKNGEEETSKLHPVSRSSTIQRSEGKLTTPVEEGRTRISTVQVELNGNRTVLLLGDQEEGSLSMTSFYNDQRLVPLDQEIACKVVKMLMSKVGGRYSTELGIDMDAGDAEVERWFLAVNLFHRHLTFDVLKETFKKLGEAGITSVGSILHMEEDEVADLLMMAGYSTYKHRAAARLRKLAGQLEAEHEGMVSTLKHMQDAHELMRHISNLHGLGTDTSTIFLRELRGLWPGAAMEYDKRTIRAAMHLRFGDFDNYEDASNKPTKNSHTSLNHIAEAAGVDERDLEVALVKLGLSHEQHYRKCPGGLVCNFLVSTH